MSGHKRLGKNHRERRWKELQMRSEKLVEKNELTEESWPIDSAEDPQKDDNGKNFFTVHWAPTQVPPAALMNCAETLQEKTPKYKNWSIDEINYDLLKLQRENDGEVIQSEDEVEEKVEEQKKNAKKIPGLNLTLSDYSE